MCFSLKLIMVLPCNVGTSDQRRNQGGGAPLTKCKGPLRDVKKGPRKIKWPESVEFLKMGVEMAPSK